MLIKKGGFYPPFFVYRELIWTRVSNFEQNLFMQQNQPAILLLEDGTVFEGIAIGKIGTTGGEIAFNTGMTGYQEVFTDPSYVGQLLIMTTAHIGNYGVQLLFLTLAMEFRWLPIHGWHLLLLAHLF